MIDVTALAEAYFASLAPSGLRPWHEWVHMLGCAAMPGCACGRALMANRAAPPPGLREAVIAAFEAGYAAHRERHP